MIMQNKERKIKIINDLLKGKNVSLAENRPETQFNLISDNLYKEVGNDRVYNLEEIQALNKPYRELNNELQDWEETKAYDDREESRFGLPYVFQINSYRKHEKQPDRIILPPFYGL